MEADENRKKTMIEKMTAVYSYVTRQKNDGRNTLLPSDMEQSLLSPYFMNCSLDPNHSQSELLLWLSVWRTGFELCEQFKRIPEWKLKHLFNVLVSFILKF